MYFELISATKVKLNLNKYLLGCHFDIPLIFVDSKLKFMMDYSGGVKWGIIGVGNVCEVKSGPALYKVPNSSLVGVMRRNGELAKDFADRHGADYWTDNAEELIQDPRINAIYIATPPNSHEYYTKLAAQAGKAVYVEKPMARNSAECQQMIDICSKSQVPLFVAYYRRYLPLFLHVKNFIDTGFIGEIRFVDVMVHKSLEPDIVWATKEQDNWRVNPEVSGGGYFIDLASHQLDLLAYIIGPIKSASGYTSNHGKLYPAEDQVIAAFEFENGVAGKGSWVFNLAENCNEERTTIYGSEGKISFTFFSDFHIFLEIDGEEPQRIDYVMPEHVQQPLIQAIVEELMGQGKCHSTGESAARTALIVDQIMKK